MPRARSYTTVIGSARYEWRISTACSRIKLSCSSLAHRFNAQRFIMRRHRSGRSLSRCAKVKGQSFMMAAPLLDDIIRKGSDLILPFVGQHYSGSFVTFKPVKSTHHGEIFASREAGTALKHQVETEGLSLEVIIEAQKTVAPYQSGYFQKIAFSPQGHLCLCLNRPVVFSKTIQDVLTSQTNYGVVEMSAQSDSILILDGFSLDFVSQKEAAKDDMATSQHAETTLSKLTLNEGRTLLIMGLLSNLLKASGHSVTHGSNYLPLYETPSAGDTSFSLWHLLQSFSFEVPRDGDRSSIGEFSSAVKSLPYNTGNQPGSALSSAQNWKHQGVVIDARTFLLETGLSGKGGYDKNINDITVTAGDGSLTAVGSLAREICTLTSGSKPTATGNMVIHIAQQRNTFAVQQAMVVADMLTRVTTTPCNQHILAVAGVECLEGKGPVRTCTMRELMSVRLQQMTEAYLIKYGERAKGPQLQANALRMTEAVVKFEFLSTDPKATVKIELPKSADGHRGVESDIRFDGAFVTYNYARLATLFTHFHRACERGVYPPLPDIAKANFSLLTEEDEWQLLFHFVLQYPALVREAAEIKKVGIGIHLEITLKKVCLFLTKLSHAFSSYYSRVKILVAPEPHLVPLIHARLFLVAAIKQVMYNALALLAIEPLEQL